MWVGLLTALMVQVNDIKIIAWIKLKRQLELLAWGCGYSFILW